VTADPPSPTRRPAPNAVLFDLGGVLLDWNPRYLYRTMLDDPDEIEAFLDEVGFAGWNAGLDAGRPWADAVAQLAAEFPHRRALIEAFHTRWPETIAGAFDGTVDLLRELSDAGVRIVALSNWSAETFPDTLGRFPFLGWFEGIALSGEIGVNKPDPRAFEAAVDRFELDPAATVFIDDSATNVEQADRMGFRALHFTGAARLRADLVALGLLPARA
jgi:2-haloacid dehalogenase